ncbi:hypothetical protein F5Y11DRAFT_129695 [Daldinia sp. FL1419]|nr:hypothetical protein F5Y11DRAFT_129695 [Daldinia sp. FL1419]
MLAPNHISESVRETTAGWVISDRIIISHRPTWDSNQLCWSDGQGSFYNLSDAPNPLPPSQPLSPTSPIKKVYEAGGIAATWKFGDVFLKLRDLGPSELQATREHVTLSQLHDRGDLSFIIPDVLFHALWGNRYMMLLKAVPGRTLGEEWPSMDEDTKTYYVDRVVGICKELETWVADYIGGVDGHHLADNYLIKRGAPLDYTNKNLVSNCTNIGMDCSVFHFYHCDLGPGNIIVNLADRSIGIIDWETAGFVPKEWIRTKFRVSGGMDLPGSDDQQYRLDWRRRVQLKLGTEGFPEVVDRWFPWWDGR